MARWPNVPAAYGWLSLDVRGRWRLDGGVVRNRATREAINRNYASDEDGNWYYQNGPQKAYVNLEYTPWVYVLDGHGQLCTHTDHVVHELDCAWIDEDMSLLLTTEYGIGIVSDQDVEMLLDNFCDADANLLDADAVEQRLAASPRDLMPLYLSWNKLIRIEPIERVNVAERFGFVQRPAPPAPSKET